MLKRIINKTGYSILVIWGVVTVIFILFNVLPGDPARMMLGQRADMQTVELIRDELGLNETFYKQYLRYLNDLSPVSVHNTEDKTSMIYFTGEKYGKALKILSLGKHTAIFFKRPYLGKSFQNNRGVGEMIAEALPNSLILAFSAILLAFLVGNAIGVFAAMRKDTWMDRVSIFISTLGMSLPSFFAAILIGWFFAYKLGHITHLNLTGNLYEIDDLGEGVHLKLKNLILPAVTLGIRPLSVIVQLSRNSMLDVLSKDYIRTAYAKGIPENRIIFRHAFRNSLAPVVTAVSGWFAGMLAGVVFVEYIFGWKGLGYMIVNALNFYDLPVVLGSVLTIAVVFVVVNILVDIIYIVLDPRLRS